MAIVRAMGAKAFAEHLTRGNASAADLCPAAGWGFNSLGIQVLMDARHEGARQRVKPSPAAQTYHRSRCAPRPSRGRGS
jgi:hypothetical protein